MAFCAKTAAKIGDLRAFLAARRANKIDNFADNTFSG